MHRFHSPAARRGLGVAVARIAVFSAALMAITGIVVADVIAAEVEEPAAMALGDAIADERGPVLLAAAVVVPNAVLPAVVSLPELIPELIPEQPKVKKKRRSGKLKFGRFEGY